MAMFQGQFHMSLRQRECVTALAEFIALIYGPYFLQSTLATAAPRLDLQLWRDLLAYEEQYADGSKQRKIAQSAKKSVRRHLWYLTEQLVVFSLFDEEVSDAERQSMATNLDQTPRPQAHGLEKLKTPGNILNNPNAVLSDFIGPGSWLLYDLLQRGSDWLTLPVIEWVDNDDFTFMKDTLKDLKVVNDAAGAGLSALRRYSSCG